VHPLRGAGPPHRRTGGLRDPRLRRPARSPALVAHRRRLGSDQVHRFTRDYLPLLT
jgi:hypothetical protein